MAGLSTTQFVAWSGQDGFKGNKPSHLLRRDVTSTATLLLLVAVVVLGLEFFVSGTVHAAGGFLKGLATAGHLYEAH